MREDKFWYSRKLDWVLFCEKLQNWQTWVGRVTFTVVNKFLRFTCWRSSVSRNKKSLESCTGWKTMKWSCSKSTNSKIPRWPKTDPALFSDSIVYSASHFDGQILRLTPNINLMPTQINLAAPLLLCPELGVPQWPYSKRYEKSQSPSRRERRYRYLEFGSQKHISMPLTCFFCSLYCFFSNQSDLLFLDQSRPQIKFALTSIRLMAMNNFILYMRKQPNGGLETVIQT